MFYISEIILTICVQTNISDLHNIPYITENFLICEHELIWASPPRTLFLWDLSHLCIQTSRSLTINIPIKNILYFSEIFLTCIWASNSLTKIFHILMRVFSYMNICVYEPRHSEHYFSEIFLIYVYDRLAVSPEQFRIVVRSFSQ